LPTDEIIEDEAAEDEFPEGDFDDIDEATIESELLELDSDDDDIDSEGAEAHDELEAEELDMLTDDETSETLVVDEAAEMRQIRREELAMDRKGADEATEGEFVCTSCFLVLRTSQLADGRRKICRDCAA
jgi:hypothetical protein